MPTIVLWNWELAPDLSPQKASDAYRDVLKCDPCSYCGDRDPMPVVDHIVARAAHGGHGWDNLTAACQACNSRKASRPLVSFLLGVPVGRHIRAGREVSW